jgi:uncharacterized protein (TIGR03435 family)
VTRTESRDQPIFELTGRGEQLKSTSPPCSVTNRENAPPSGPPPDVNRPGCGLITFGGGVFRGHGVTLDQIAGVLSTPTGRVVRNQTALDGAYDFELRFSPQRENPNPADPPVIFTAVREQLGLELRAARGPVEFLIIVSAQPLQLDE